MLPHPALRLSAFYAATFLVIGIQLPFWPVWLAARGLDTREIGVALAAAIWVKVLATPAIGALPTGRARVAGVMGALAAAALARLCRAVARHSFGCWCAQPGGAGRAIGADAARRHITLGGVPPGRSRLRAGARVGLGQLYPCVGREWRGTRLDTRESRCCCWCSAPRARAACVPRVSVGAGPRVAAGHSFAGIGRVAGDRGSGSLSERAALQAKPPSLLRIRDSLLALARISPTR